MPYKSDAQRRLFHALAARGEMPKKTVKEFDTASKGMDLPEYVKMYEGGMIEEDTGLEDELYGEADSPETAGEPGEDHSSKFFEALKNRIRKVRGY